MNPVTASHRAAARAEAYRLLSALFCDPDVPSLLAEDVPARLERTLEAAGSSAVAAARALSAALANADAEGLRVEHARLFIGPGELPAPPYGSVYLDEGRRLFGPSTSAAAHSYEEAGLVLDEVQHELPDHVAAELEFLHVLAWREQEALARSALEEADRAHDAAHGFLTQHLGRWAQPFAQRIQEHTTEPVYRHLSEVLVTFIDEGRAPRQA